jgi:RecJ-like exonuclease
MKEITIFSPVEVSAITPFDCVHCGGLGYVLINHFRKKCVYCEGRGIITKIGTLPKIKELRLKRKMIDDSLKSVRFEYKKNQETIVFLRKRNREIRKQIGLKLKEREKFE